MVKNLEIETYNIMNIKHSYCGETLLSIHSPGVMQHIFSFNVYIHSLE